MKKKKKKEREAKKKEDNLINLKSYKVCIYCENGRNQDGQVKRGKVICHTQYFWMSDYSSLLKIFFGNFYNFFRQTRKQRGSPLAVCKNCVSILKEKKKELEKKEKRKYF